MKYGTTNFVFWIQYAEKTILFFYSAADLFFTKYLKNFFDERQYTRKEVLRLYAADREPLSTPLEFRESFCIYDPNDGKFAKPTTTQMHSKREYYVNMSF